MCSVPFPLSFHFDRPGCTSHMMIHAHGESPLVIFCRSGRQSTYRLLRLVPDAHTYTTTQSQLILSPTPNPTLFKLPSTVVVGTQAIDHWSKVGSHFRTSNHPYIPTVLCSGHAAASGGSVGGKKETKDMTTTDRIRSTKSTKQ